MPGPGLGQAVGGQTWVSQTGQAGKASTPGKFAKKPRSHQEAVDESDEDCGLSTNRGRRTKGLEWARTFRKASWRRGAARVGTDGRGREKGQEEHCE